MSIEFERTPEERFEGLADHPFDANYTDIDGLRMAWTDVGEGPPVIFIHGEPTWSYLWRKVVAPVRDAGFRCIAPDLIGFGRSDKPTDLDWYSYDRHCEMLTALFNELDLNDATVVVHDWGGPIGMRLAAENPDRVARLAILDTGLFTGEQAMSKAWFAFRDFVERTEDLPIGMLVRGACGSDPGDEVIAAYDAPFHNPASKAGARAFPLMMPLTPDAPGTAGAKFARESLIPDTRPKLVIWADRDPIIPLAAGEAMARMFGNGPIDHVIEGASHFLQEDAGSEIGSMIADWLSSDPGPRTHTWSPAG
jgi:haloalkane dehalogenase